MAKAAQPGPHNIQQIQLHLKRALTLVTFIKAGEMKRDKLTINIIANAMYSISGGDKIFIEFSRRWSEKGHVVNVFTVEKGLNLCRSYNLANINYHIWSSAKVDKFGPVVSYIIRTIRGCFIAAIKRIPDGDNVIIYSASDFWPDSLPAWLMKKRLKHSKWVACFYLFAPNPFKSSSDIEYRGGRVSFSLKNLAYYLSQKLAYRLIRQYADFILVANELDKRIFVKDGMCPAKVKPVYGGVDIKAISQIPPPQSLKYDGCFVGRLHFQKGPLELVRIWELVCKTRPEAKLALIGDGPLENKVKDEIRRMGLEKNIDVLGYVDGDRKYNILKSSRVFLHTPVLDTGGMAAAEGMACGLPVVGFDLTGYEFCYPQGMLKAPIGDLEAFAEIVLNLLRDGDIYDKIKRDAMSFVQKWDWDKKADQILKDFNKMLVENG